FNYLDRWIVAALAESMKHSELQLSDTQLGSLMTGFIIVYMVAAPLFGSLGDARSRTRLLGLGVAIWSVATALAGLATSYASLFAARAAVGVGEAAYGTISPALLADYFPRERRGRVFAVFFAAIPVGSALGYIVGGLVDHYFGRRASVPDAGLPRAYARHSAGAGDRAVRGHRGSHGIHRDLRRGLDRRLLPSGLAAGVPVGVGRGHPRRRSPHADRARRAASRRLLAGDRRGGALPLRLHRP